MAIIEQLGMFANVTVEGTPLPEYEDPEPECEEMAEDGFTSVRNKYVEAKDDSEFSVSFGVSNWQIQSYKSHDPNFAVLFSCYVDGECVYKPYLDRDTPTAKLEGVKELDPVTNSTKLRRFKFASITTVDDADKKTIKRDCERSQHLGLIQIVVSRVIRHSKPDTPRCSPAAHTSMSFAEKALKGRAISHGAGLSPATPCRPNQFYKNNPCDKSPIAIFNFKYRSRAALQNLLIIPYPQSRSPTLSIDDLDSEEVQRLARERLGQLNADKRDRKPAIKREFDETFDLTGDDGPRRPLKVSKVGGYDTIDLTDD